MKTINILLIIGFFYFLLISCFNNQKNKKDEALFVELIGTYSNRDLFRSILQTDSLLGISNKSKRDQENAHPLMNLFRPNIFQDKAGTFFLSTSIFIGFSAPKDTSAIINYLRFSPFIPDSITYEWLLINEPVSEFALIAHKPNEVKILLSNQEIESISVENGNVSSASGLKGLIQATQGSDKTVKIKLNQLGYTKVSGILSTDAILLKTNFGNRNYEISQPTDEIKDGILISNNITGSFVDSINQMYPSIMITK